MAGLEINEKFRSQFCDRIPKFSRNLATFSRRIFALHFPVSSLAKQNMSPQFLCVVTFLFRKSRGKISRKFATSLDILVAKGKKLSHKCDCIGRNFEPCAGRGSNKEEWLCKFPCKSANSFVQGCHYKLFYCKRLLFGKQ